MQLTSNEQIVGSIPTSGSSLHVFLTANCLWILFHAVPERIMELSSKQFYAGSSPVSVANSF